MCRHLAYLGPPASVAELVFDAPHSLCDQAVRPQLQRNGTSNPDGFGFGWYADGELTPSTFRDARPIWSDAAFAASAADARGHCYLAACRLATPGFPVETRCTQPFASGPYLFSHNGAIERLDRVRDKLGHELDDLDDLDVPDVQAPVDSAFVFGLALARWRRGMGLAEGLADVVATLAGVTGGRINLLASDGHALAGTTHGESLFLGDGLGVVLSSEPCDGLPGWQRIPPGSVVAADTERVTITPIPTEPT